MTNVLVTGAGGPAGVGTIQSLRRKKGYKIYGGDSNRLASGLYLSDKGFVLPTANSRDYFQKVFEICKKFKVDVIFPTLTEESIVIAENAGKLESAGIKLIASSESALRLCNDKLRFYNFLKENGIAVPKTFRNQEEATFPAAVKLRIGRGSRGFHKVEDLEELRFVVSRNKKKYNSESLIQEFVEGTEYSLDVLSDLKHKPLVISPRVRLLVDSGISVNAKIERNKEVEKMAGEIARLLNIRGPSNVQIILSRKTNTPVAIEVNPRIAGTTVMTTYAGINIPDLAIKIFTGKKFEVPKLKYDLFMTRYLENIVLDKFKVL